MDQPRKRKNPPPFPGRPQGRLKRWTWPVTSYLVTNITVTLMFLLFRVLNRTRFEGTENVPHGAGTLMLSNHQTMIDSFLVGIGAYYPYSWWRPSVMPWNPAAEENYFRPWWMGFLADNWKCIPIQEGRKDVGAVRKMVHGLKTSPLVLFPEGTRSRDGEIGPGRSGAGMLTLLAKPTVIPVSIEGMDQILPVGCKIPRLFKRVTVRYGKPLDLSAYYGRRRGKDVSQEIVDLIMDEIRKQRGDRKKQRIIPMPADPASVAKSDKARRSKGAGWILPFKIKGL